MGNRKFLAKPNLCVLKFYRFSKRLAHKYLWVLKIVCIHKVVGTLKKLWVCKIVDMQNNIYLIFFLLKFAGTQNVVSTQNLYVKNGGYS